MAETRFEQEMDDYVVENVRLWWSLSKRYGDSWENIPKDETLAAHADYSLTIGAFNQGSETFVKNTQIRLVPGAAMDGFYFSDSMEPAEGSTSPVRARGDTEIFAGIVGPGEFTPFRTRYFRVTSPVSNGAELFGYAIYAEIVPQAHRWATMEVGHEDSRQEHYFRPNERGLHHTVERMPH